MKFSFPRAKAGGGVVADRQRDEWLWRAPRPTFWRAATDNDRGCGFRKRRPGWQRMSTCRTSALRSCGNRRRCAGALYYGVPPCPALGLRLTLHRGAAGRCWSSPSIMACPVRQAAYFGVKFRRLPRGPALWMKRSGETLRIAARAASGRHEKCHTLTLSSRTAACIWAPIGRVEQHASPQAVRRRLLTIEQADAPLPSTHCPTLRRRSAAQHICPPRGTGNDDPAAHLRRQHRQLGHRCGGALPRQRGR